MKTINKIDLKTWPIWSQVLLVFLIASILFGAISGRIVQQMETNHLFKKQRLFSKKTFQTILSGSIEAIIVEDRSILNTTVNEFAAVDEDLYYLSIKNEDGDILVEWKKDELVSQETLLTFSEKVIYEGEVFGSIKIIWDTKSVQKEIESHVMNIQFFVALTILLLALVILAWLYIVIIKPMAKLIFRLDPDNFNSQEPVSISGFLPIEFKRLHMMIDKLKEVSISREELTKEVAIRQQAERAAELAKDEAVRANKVKSIFLATMSHELRTPLNAVIGYSDLLLADSKKERDDEEIEIIGTIKMSGIYLLDIINSILDLSKIEADKMKMHLDEINTGTLINEVKMIIFPMMEKNNNKLEIYISGETGSLVSDSTRLHQILLNLLSNAAKFTKNGTVTLDVNRDQNNTIFTIKDTGIGIAQDEIDNLFTPFMQGDNSLTREYQGTGLGLAITMRLVELLDGTMTVSSEKSVGATFVVTLPHKALSESLTQSIE